MRAALVLALMLFAIPASLFAQSVANVPIVLVKDEARIWTSPFRLHPFSENADTKWLTFFAAGTAAFLVTDHAVREDVVESPGLRSPSNKVSNLGGGFAFAGVSAGLFTLGKATGNSRLSETGLLVGEAVIHSTIVAGGLKKGFNRMRPYQGNGSGTFWGGGSSFPSGHSTAAWSMASVVAHEYHDRPLIGIGAYGLAGTVSLARVGGLNHFPSDVAVGAVFGELIGRFVVHRHGKN